jgi:hypothetical protein
MNLNLKTQIILALSLGAQLTAYSSFTDAAEVTLRLDNTDNTVSAYRDDTLVESDLGFSTGDRVDNKWQLTDAAEEVLARTLTDWSVKRHLRMIKPHLAIIREAFPDVTLWRLRDVRLTDVNGFAVIARYRDGDPDRLPCPSMGGFGLSTDGRSIVYVEAEIWRYEPLQE